MGVGWDVLAVWGLIVMEISGNAARMVTFLKGVYGLKMVGIL